MGRKFDINKPRTMNNNIKKNSHNFYHNYNNDESNFSPQNELNQEKINNTYYRDYELPEKADITIKMPIKVPKILIVAIIATIFMLLMIFIVIFYDDENYSSNSLYKYGQTCETVSITDTENYLYDSKDITFEDYIAGVVAAESDGRTESEYLKLLAIYARTYFLNNANNTCTVEGNENFQKYIDVEDSNNKDLVEKAVESTRDYIIIYDDDILDIEYSSGCIVNYDGNNYYIKYIEVISGEIKYQQISKDWASQNGLITELNNLSQSIDETETNYQNRECPPNTTEYGMSKIGALYLITKENYDYRQVIEYYNGSESLIVKNEIEHSGVNNGEFINPTSSINCTSPYGHRTHPVKGESAFHTGIDIGIAGGSSIYATKNGIVRQIEKNVKAINNCDYGYGNYIIIDHSDGTSTLYAHMKYGSISDSISKGSSIAQGEQIGQVGSTGCSTGNHLHYEVMVNGSTVDPADYIDLTSASGICKR